MQNARQLLIDKLKANPNALAEALSDNSRFKATDVLSTEKCARTVCNRPHDNCKHSHDGRLYCESCAIRINRTCGDMNLVNIPRLNKTDETIST
jgi:hypothetical protein